MLFSNAQVSLGTYLTSTNVNRNIFKLVSQYWAQTTYATESQYELTSRAIPSNLWSELYRNVLNDLKDAKSKVQEDELLPDAQKQNQIACIDIVNIYTYYHLVNIFGDIPYSEALDPTNAQPAYDTAEDIYADLLTRLDAAISNIDPNADGFGSADVFYAGDMALWHKFANSLKMRIGITLADVQPGVAETAITEADANAFSSNADNAMIQFQSAPPHTSPLWEALVQSGRHDYVPANTLVDHMNAVSDPRRPAIITMVDTNTVADDPADMVYLGGTYGTTNTYSMFSHHSETVKSPTFAGTLLEYAEIEFIRAEANERGWLTGTSAQAAVHYNNAIEADMETWDVASGDIATYQNQSSVTYPLTGTEQERMDAIAKQKWFGLYLQGLQAWTEWRRLDAPAFNAPENQTVNDIPTRFTYPIDEQNLNKTAYETAVQNLPGGEDVLTAKIFWDVN
jgi:hypothetical protein